MSNQLGRVAACEPRPAYRTAGRRSRASLRRSESGTDTTLPAGSRSARSSRRRSRPCRRPAPGRWSGNSNPSSSLIVVVLPEPLGPSRPKISPRRISRSRAFKARTLLAAPEVAIDLREVARLDNYFRSHAGESLSWAFGGPGPGGGRGRAGATDASKTRKNHDRWRDGWAAILSRFNVCTSMPAQGFGLREARHSAPLGTRRESAKHSLYGRPKTVSSNPCRARLPFMPRSAGLTPAEWLSLNCNVQFTEGFTSSETAGGDSRGCPLDWLQSRALGKPRAAAVAASRRTARRQNRPAARAND